MSFPLLLTLLLSIICCLVQARRQRQEIAEIAPDQITQVINHHPFVALLHHDRSEVSVKALSDLELIQADSNLFGIQWYRVIQQPDSPNLSLPSSTTVVLYRHGQPVLYPGRPDRQTAVFRFLVTEVFCSEDEALEVSFKQLEALIRTFRNFILVAYSEGDDQAFQVLNELKMRRNLCQTVDRTLIASTKDSEALSYLDIKTKALPVVLNIIHGISVEFRQDEKKMGLEKLLKWIRAAKHGKVKHVNTRSLQKVIDREELLLILFLGERQRPLAAKLKVSLTDLETTFGLAVVISDDRDFATSGKVIEELREFPAVILHLADEGGFRIYNGTFKSSVAAIDIQNWVVQQLEEAEKNFVITEVEAASFKSHPQDYKHLLLKDHKDSMRKLSTEYQRLLIQKDKLKKIIDKAMAILKEAEALDPSVEVTTGTLSLECNDCLSAVGQAVWNCGTLEFECIQNTLELKSECFGCVCEVMDSWWPNDAPNCMSKEVKKIVSPEVKQLPKDGNSNQKEKRQEL